jgi:hypothetical protein
MITAINRLSDRLMLWIIRRLLNDMIITVRDIATRHQDAEVIALVGMTDRAVELLQADARYHS